jgi:hypothetical protein
MLDKFYILVDNRLKMIISMMDELPINWHNISNIASLPDEKLKDLTWSGNENLGWIPVFSESLSDYAISEETLDLNKRHVKKFFSEKIKKSLEETVTYSDYEVDITSDTRMDLCLKRLNQKDLHYLKCKNGVKNLTHSQLCELCEFVENRVESIHEWEEEILQQIDSCTSISDIVNIDYEYRDNI